MTFFNIFSKGKPKRQRVAKVVVDDREKNSLVPAELSALGAQVEFRHLAVGDYIVGNVAIERKTISDLKNSIINKRLITQLLELQQYPKKLLLVEGVGEEMYVGGIHENALRGFLLSVVLEHGIPIVFTLDEQDSAKYIFLLAKKKENAEKSLRASKLALTDDEQLQYILEGFPKIGPKTAKELLTRFKSLKGVFNASESELRDALGKKADRFIELLHRKFKNQS
ncbi:hypothetical protein D6817_00710 [Candidatus Pacearchaeota archaeon]|nr:MAG: hypothetical protein D6817_00710 [Candidatus Pacearchaeota archaeon]